MIEGVLIAVLAGVLLHYLFSKPSPSNLSIDNATDISEDIALPIAITFGLFEQDNDLEDGAEPIAWQRNEAIFEYCETGRK